MKLIDGGKRSEALAEVNPVENISKYMKKHTKKVTFKRKPFPNINCKTMHMSSRILWD